MLEEEIIHIIKNTLIKLGYSHDEIILGIPKKLKYGDYYTPIAFKIAKILNKDPYKIANEIAKNLPKINIIKKVKVVKPGFINFYIDNFLYVKETCHLIKRKFRIDSERKKKIVLEFGQPNTHKIPHIGHLYSYIYGESLARILEFCSEKVVRVNYQGDIGLHVAKCLWAIKKNYFQEKDRINSMSLKKRVAFLQKCYQEGSLIYEKDEKTKKEIDELNIKIYQKDSEILNLWLNTRQWSLDFYKKFEKELGIKYDRYYFESETAPLGKKIVLENMNKVFERSENTVIFNGEKFGLHTRVFINKYGNPTYEAKDIGLVFLKNKEYDFDCSIVTTANEQNEYWKVVIKVIELIFPDLRNKILHLGFGMINLKSGKMSSRTGEIIDPFTLIEKIKEEIKNKFQVDKEDLLEKITMASIKYSLLMSDYKKNIVFDMEKSVAKEGNSGPYLLYTYVRAKSVLEKAGENIIKQIEKNLTENKIDSFLPEEIELLKKICLFRQFIKKSREFYSPNIIANYLYDIAANFNLFYQKYPILKANEPKRSLRLIITNAISIIINQGLNLLGIETVEKM